MRILQISNKLPYPPKDGGSIATFSMARAFADLGHEVTILAMNTSKHYFDPQNIPDTIQDKIHFLAVDTDTRISPLDALKNLLTSDFPYNAQRFITRDFSRQLNRLLRDEHFDVIQLEGLYVAPYTEEIRKESNALVSMRAHNVEHEIWERTSKQSRFLKKKYLQILTDRIRRMEKQYINSYDVLVPITERDGNRFRELGCHLPLFHAPTGIFTEELNPDRSGIDFPSVFHIGALDWSPNQEGIFWFLEKVWPELHRNHPDLKFYIAGRNAPPQISNIKTPGVVFLGEVEDAYEFMRSKAIMIVPLLSGSGMRIKIIEGMALGKTIVSTSIGTEGIATTHEKNLLIADDPENFVKEIIGLLENFDKFDQLGRNAVDFVNKNYDNMVITRSLLEFYKKNL